MFIFGNNVVAERLTLEINNFTSFYTHFNKSFSIMKGNVYVFGTVINSCQ